MTDSQASLFDAIYRKLHPRLAITMYTQFGKQLSDDTPVLTNDGWKNHGDLLVGDVLFNGKGEKVKVLAVHEPSDENDLEVEFTNGERITCHANHEWIVKHRNWKEYKKIETKKILEYKLKSAHYYIFSVPSIEPLEFEEQELPLDPYTLGAWLGDGTTTKPSITSHPDDKAIIDNIPFEPSAVHKHKTTGILNYDFWGTEFYSKLKELGLIIRTGTVGYKGIGKKFIPDIYKKSSIKQRLELLAGLIDTDGNVSKKCRKEGWTDGRIYFSNINKGLIDDVVEVVRSLGMKPCVVKTPACLSSSGIQGRHDVYTIGFEAFIDIPTKLERKKVTPKKKKKISIKSITKVQGKKGRCITVDGGVYLAGRKLIPTHNSEIVSMAVLTRITTFSERWVIIGGSEDKAKIIMNKLIGHIFDNDYTKSKLSIKQNDNIERLRHERSRSKITFNIDGGIGEVFILSGDVSKKGQDAGDILVGHGAENIIADDSQLLPNVINAKMVRMLGGYKDNFLIKIGNATSPRSHHFYKAFQSPRYKTVVLDYKVGIEEGRQAKEFFDEMREEYNDIVLFNSFYECIFPPADAPISGVWIPILSEDDIEDAMRWEKPPRFGMSKLGVDVADTGIDHDALVGRDSGFAEILYDNQNADQMTLAGIIMSTYKDYGKVYVDKGGVGAGVCSRLRQERFPHAAVAFGEKSMDPMFQNRKAEMFWSARNWILRGGKLSKDRRWKQLSDIMYSLNESNGKIQIMPKKMALNMGIKSPDIGDAFACTFYERDRYKSPEKKEEDFFNKKMRKKKQVRKSQYNLKMT